jgi:hypothetical protein
MLLKCYGFAPLPAEPELESAWFQPFLNPEMCSPGFRICFQMDVPLRRGVRPHRRRGVLRAVRRWGAVYKLELQVGTQLPRSLQAPGFNP